MKIVIVNSLYYPYKFGGAEVSVQLLAEGLVSKGNSVKVITLNDKKKIIRDNINGVDVVSFPIRNVYWPFKKNNQTKIKKICWHVLDYWYNPIVRHVEKELLSDRPDVVHTNNLAGFSVAIWDLPQKINCPLVHTVRDYYLFYPNSTLFKNGKNMDADGIDVQCYSWYKKYKSKKIDVMIGISKYISDLHKEHGFSKHAEHAFIYNPINKLKIDKSKNGQVNVGFFGRLTSEKGFDVFIEYAKRYRHSMRFVAAGEFASSDDAVRLKSDAIEAGVILRGYTPANIFFSEIDALLLPTKWNEPFGRAVAEAAVAGLPVFTNLTGGVKEIADYYPWVRDLQDFNTSNVKNINSCTNSTENSNPFMQDILTQQYLDVYDKTINAKNINPINNFNRG